MNYAKKSACFASPISRSPPLNRHVSSQRSLFFNRAHNTNQLSLCLDSGRLCHSRQFREWLWTADTCRSPFLRSKAKLLLHNFLSVVVNRSCLMRVFLQRFIFKQFAALCFNRVIFLAFVSFSQFYEKRPSTYKKCWSGVDIAKKIIKSS